MRAKQCAAISPWRIGRWTDGRNSQFPHIWRNTTFTQSLELNFKNGTKWEASLEEAVLPEDDVTSYPNRVPTFHGYSASGKANAEFVYVGRGQQVDFERLIELGVDLKGKIALARYGGPFR
jgi:N-acetylated-alpha-linked acidic dipeptidase